MPTTFKETFLTAAVFAAALSGTGVSASPFSPQEGTVASVERPFRDEVCLNGRWRFQPVPLPPLPLYRPLAMFNAHKADIPAWIRRHDRRRGPADGLSV